MGSSGRRITTADIAPGATSQMGMAVVSATSSAFSTTTNVDIAGSLVALTTTGGDVLDILMLSVYSATAGSGIYAGLTVDGGTSVGDQPLILPTVNQQTMLCTMYRHTGASLGAAAHNFRPVWRVFSGSAQITVGYHIVLELKR